MYLRANPRFKDGKEHRYWSIVESKRCAGGKIVQRQVLYLGEINDSQQQAWRRTLEVFDEDRRQYCELSLFPDDRPLPPGAADAVSVKLDPGQRYAFRYVDEHGRWFNDDQPDGYETNEFGETNCIIDLTDQA